MRAAWFAVLLLVPVAARALPPYATETGTLLVTPEVDPFAWEVSAPVLASGGEGRLELRLLVPDGHVAYRDQLEVRILSDGGLKAGAADFPPALVSTDPYTGEPREQYVDDVVVWVPVKAPRSLASAATMTVETRHQGCRPGLCFPPTTVEHTVLVPVRAEPTPTH